MRVRKDGRTDRKTSDPLCVSKYKVKNETLKYSGPKLTLLFAGEVYVQS